MMSTGFPRTRTKTRGQVSEIAVLAPIRRGRVPGERRTFEQRLRQVIEAIDKRSEQGIPAPLNKIQTVHFGRLLVIRPEQYLYKFGADETAPPFFDDYLETPMTADNPDGAAEASPNPYRSYLLTIVSFDGELKPYFRDIADFLGEDFDKLFENCEDFDTTDDFEGFWAWIKRYQISLDLFFAAYPDLTVAEIKRLQYFKARFDDFVARLYGGEERSPAEIGALFTEFLRDNHHYGHGFPSDGGVFRSLDETA